MFSKFNKKRTINEKIDTTNFEYRPLKDFAGEEVVIYGYFFTDGQYGRQVVLVAEDCFINMPLRTAQEIHEMLLFDGVSEAIIEGKMKLCNIEVMKAKKGTTTIYEYGDV